MVSFLVPLDDTDLGELVTNFVLKEFGSEITREESVEEVNERSVSEAAKRALLVITVIASVEGTLQFAERVERYQRVTSLIEAVKKSGKSVYLTIKKETVDLSKVSSDEVMNLLSSTGKD